MTDLNGTVVAITGASAGIGAAAARLLAAEGASVVLERAGWSDSTRWLPRSATRRQRSRWTYAIRMRLAGSWRKQSSGTAASMPWSPTPGSAPTAGSWI